VAADGGHGRYPGVASGLEGRGGVRRQAAVAVRELVLGRARRAHGPLGAIVAGVPRPVSEVSP
jgi:hypothetical protein